MPLDVLGQLQEASANVNDEQLKSSLDNIIQSASESQSHLDALRAIMSALTQGGNQLSGSLDKVVFYFEKFEERTTAAKNAMFGFSNSMQSLDTKSLNDVNSLLIKIENQQKALSQKINFFPNIKDSLHHLNKISQDLVNIQKLANKGVNINVQYSGAPKIQKAVIKGQAFSRGGAVSYNPSNSRKAKTGGQFIGKRKGDREIAFVNAGQAIITQRAIKAGARQSGMSVGSYISNLNSGNISKIKRGRSFAEGTITGKQTEINNLQQKTKKGGVETRQKGDELKSTINELKSVFENYAKNNSGASADSVDKILDLLKSGSLNKKIVGYIQQRLKIDGKFDIAQLKNSPELISDLIDQLDEMSDQIESGRKKILTFKDAWEDFVDQAQKNLKRGIENIPILGKWAVDTNNKMLLLGAGIAMVGQQLPKFLGSLASWTVKQSELNKSMSQFSATANTFGTSTSALARFKDEMNLTREQAAQLTDTFRTIGVQGNLSFSQIQTLAAGIKDQFGKLDTTLLKDAIQLVKDIPKQQVDVLIRGTGSFDDTGNLIANLIQGGKLQATAQIIAKGGFGAVQGVTPQMSESDKKTIEMQEKMNQWLDHIYATINKYLPDSAKLLAVVGTAINAIAVPVVKGLGSFVTMATGVGKLALASSGTHIRTHDIAGGGSFGGGGGSLGGGLGGKKGGITRLPAVMRKYGGRTAGKLGQSMVRGGGSLVKGLGSVATKIGSVIGSTLAAAGPYLAIATVLYGIGSYVKNIADEMKQQEQEKRRKSSQHNLQHYGVAVDTHVVSDKEMKEKRNATVGGETLKGAAIGVGTGALAGAVIGSVIPVVGTAVGAVIGGIIGGVVGYAKGDKEAKEEQAIVKKENEGSQIALEAIKQIEKNEKARINALNDIGIKTVDVRKSILALAPIVKRIQMISKGAYTQADRQRMAAAQAEKNWGMRAGASTASVLQQSQNSFGYSLSAFRTEKSLYKQTKQDVQQQLKNGEIGYAQAQQQLLFIKQEQIKKLNELVDALERNTIDFRKLPQHISASLAQSFASTLANFMNNSFIGDSSTAADLATQQFKNSQIILANAIQVTSHNLKQLKSYDEQVSNTQKEDKARLRADIAAAQKMGIQIKPGEGETEEERMFNGADEAIAKFMQNYSRAVSQDPMASSLQNASNSLKQYVNTFGQLSQSLRTMSNEQYSAMSQESKDSLLQQSENAANAAINTIKSAVEKGNLSQGQANARIEEITKTLSEARSSSKGTSEKDKRLFVAALNKLGATTLQQSVKFEGMAQEIVLANSKSFVNSQGGKEKVKAMFNLKNNRDALITTQNTSRQVEIKKQEELLKLFSQYQEQANKFAAAVALVYKSANIMYREVMSQNLSKTERVRAHGVGGARAVSNTRTTQMDATFARVGAYFAAERENQKAVTSQSETASDANLQKIKDKQLAEYFRLIRQENEAKLEYLQNPDNAEARLRFFQAQQKRNEQQSRLGGITKIQDRATKEGENAFKMFSTLTYTNQSLMNQSKNFAGIIESLSNQLEDFHNAVKRAIDLDFNVRQVAISRQRSSALGSLSEQRGDIDGMRQSAQQIGDLTKEEYRLKMQVMQESQRKQLEKLRQHEEKIRDQIDKNRQTNRDAAEKLQAHLNDLIKRRGQVEKEAQNERIKLLTQASEQIANHINSAFQKILDAVDRKQQSLEIQKDLLSTIGAPFEMILDIQQQIIKTYRDKAEIQQQRLDELMANGIKGKLLEQQKLKTAKAQAQVLKAAFGAQRDSLDKMLGKMMGTFDQVGGIFGPDGERMIARKFGQGYAVNGVNMAVTADPNQSHNSFKQRSFANSRVAYGNVSAQSIMNGHQAYSPERIGSPDAQTSSALQHTQDVINANSMEVSTQRVKNLIVDGNINGNIQGASKGGYVWGGKIRAFSKGGPSDPRDNIPALLRRGEFVLTPEDVTKAVQVGKLFEQGFALSDGKGGDSSKTLISMLGVITNINKLLFNFMSEVSTSGVKIQHNVSNQRAQRNYQNPKSPQTQRYAGQRRFRQQQDVQQQYLRLNQEIKNAQLALSKNPSNQKAKQQLAKSMQKMQQFFDRVGDFRMGSPGENTVDFSVDMARYRQSQKDLSQLSTQQLQKLYDRENQKTSDLTSKGISGFLLQSQQAIEARIAAELNRRRAASLPQLSNTPQLAHVNYGIKAPGSSVEEQEIYFHEPQTPAGIKRILGGKNTPFSAVKGAGFEISMDSLMDGSAQQYIRNYEAAQKEYEDARKAERQRRRNAQKNAASANNNQTNIALVSNVKNSSNTSSAVGSSPDRMITNGKNLINRVRQAYKSAGVVTLGDMYDKRVLNERRKRGTNNETVDSNEVKQEDLLLQIANDVHEILQILRGDYNTSQAQDNVKQEDKPHVGPRKAPDYTQGMGASSNNSPLSNSPLNNFNHFLGGLRYFYKSKERGLDYTNFYKLLGNIGLSKSSVRSFFSSFQKIFSNPRQFFGKINNWGKTKIKSGISWLKDKGTNIKRDFVIGRMGVKGGFVSGLGDKYQKLLNGLGGLKQAFIRGKNGLSVSPNQIYNLDKQSYFKNIFGSGLLKGVAHLAGQGFGAVGDLSKTIMNSINNSFLVHYSKQMLKTQVKGLKLSFQKGLQGKSVFPEMKSDKMSSFKKVFGKGFFNGIANIGGRVVRTGNKLFADKITNTKIGIKMAKQDAQKFLKRDSFIRGQHGAKQPVGSSKFQKTANVFGKLMNVFSQATNSIRQSVFGSISQKELNKKAAVMFKKINPNFVNQTLRQKRSDVVKQQAQRILSRPGNRYTETQALRKAYRRYDRGVLKDESGVALKDVHRQQMKQEANQRLSEIKDKIRHDIRENTLAKRFVRRFITGKVSNDVRRRMVKNAKNNLFPGYKDYSKVSSHLRQYEIKGLADQNNLLDSEDYRRTYDSVRFKHAKNAVEQIKALDNNNELKKSAYKGAKSDLQKGLYNNRINEITDDLTKAEVKKIRNTAKQDLKSGKITKAEYRQRISNINRDNIRNKVSSKAERMALDQAYNKNFKELRGKEINKIISREFDISSQQLHKETNDEMRRKINFLAEKKVEKTLRNSSLKGKADILRRKFNVRMKRGRSNFFVGVRDGFNGEKWNAKKSRKGKLGWGIGRVLRYGKNTAQGFRAGIRGEGFKSQSGFWGKTGLGFGRLFAPSVNFVRGGLAGIRGESFGSQSGFWGKTGWVLGQPANWGRRFTIGAQSFLNNERGLRYNAAGRIINNQGRFVSPKNLNWGQRARLNFSAGYGGYSPSSKGLSYRLGQGARIFKPIIQPISYGIDRFNYGNTMGMSGANRPQKLGFMGNMGYYTGKTRRFMGQYSPLAGAVGSGLLGFNQLLDVHSHIQDARNNQMPIDYNRVISGTLGGLGGIHMGGGMLLNNTGLGAVGKTLSVMSSIPDLFAMKQVYDEYGNYAGTKWDSHRASYSLQNLATYALPMFRGGSSMVSWGALGQAVGGLMQHAGSKMDEGWGKDIMTTGGRVVGNLSAFGGDLAMTLATGGLNKVLQGGFELFRLFGTDEGAKKIENIGLGASLTDIALSMSGLKSLGAAFGTDIFEGFSIENAGLTALENTQEKERAHIINKEAREQHKHFSTRARDMEEGYDDRTAVSIAKHERQRNKRVASLYAKGDVGKFQTEMLLDASGTVLRMGGLLSPQEKMAQLHNTLNDVNLQRNTQAQERTAQIREQIMSYDNNLATYNAMNEQQKASEQGRRLQQSIDSRSSTIGNRRLQLQQAENNEREIKAQSQVFSAIFQNPSTSGDKLRTNLQNSRAQLMLASDKSNQARANLGHQELYGTMYYRNKASKEYEDALQAEQTARQKVQQDTSAYAQFINRTSTMGAIMPQLLNRHANGELTNSDYLNLAAQTGTQLTQQQIYALTGRDEKGNYTDVLSDEEIANINKYYEEKAKEEEKTQGQSSSSSAGSQFQVGLVDVGKKDDIGTNVQKIVRILQQRLGGENPYSNQGLNLAPRNSGFFEDNNLSYNYAITTDRDYADFDKNDTWTQSIIQAQSARQFEHYNDAAGVFSKNYKEVSINNFSDREDTQDYSQGGYLVSKNYPYATKSDVKVKLSIEPNEFMNLLRQKSVAILNSGLSKSGGVLTDNN